MADIGELRDRVSYALNPDGIIPEEGERLLTHIFNFWSKAELETFVEFVEDEEGIETDEEE